MLARGSTERWVGQKLMPPVANIATAATAAIVAVNRRSPRWQA
jgi:hypothetical protein